MQLVQLGLMGGDIVFRLLVGGGKLPDQRLTLIPVRDHVQPQAFEFLDAAHSGVPLGAQRRLRRFLLADLRRQCVGLFQQIALAALALLRLTAAPASLSAISASTAVQRC